MSVVFVTGSSRGLGRAIALAYAKGGFDVIVHYRKEKEKAMEVVKKIESYGRCAYLVQADLKKEEDINRMCTEIDQKIPCIDVLVNNAAIAKEKTKEDFLEVLEVNLIGTFLLSKKIGSKMLKEQKGVIINISSTNALDTPYVEGLDYDASKAALISLTHNLANSFAPYVRVNAVCPRWIETDMSRDLDEKFREQEENKILLHRFAKPDEVASLIYFLGGCDASYINDSIIRIDGGIKK